MQNRRQILLSHPTGNSFVREVLATLLEQDLLAAFYTSLAFHEEHWALKYTGSKLSTELKRRAYSIPKKKLKTAPYKELLRLFKNKLLGSSHRSHKNEIDSLYCSHDRRVSKKLKSYSIKAIYAYEDAALESFKKAHSLNIKCIYELPIVYWDYLHPLLNEEAYRYPKWEKTLISTRDSVKKCFQKIKEAELADYIICPSQFVKHSLPKRILDSKPCVVIPYGASLPDLKNLSPKSRSKKQAIKVLFVGSFTQRKGLADLFWAMKQVSPEKAELTLIGSPIEPLAFYKNEFPNFKFYPPMPQEAVLRFMQTQDILALPSIAEGRALVQLEALGAGLPILITPNTGGEDILEEGKNGFMVPIRNPEAIAEKIEWLYENQEILPNMKEHARHTAEKHNWIKYRKQLAQFIESL